MLKPLGLVALLLLMSSCGEVVRRGTWGPPAGFEEGPPLADDESVSTRVDPDWNRGALIGSGGRFSPYGWQDEELAEHRLRGAQHVLFYPMDETASLIPAYFLKDSMTGSSSTLRDLLLKISSVFTGMGSVDDFEGWLGLPAWPKAPVEAPNPIPFPEGGKPRHRLGTTYVETLHGTAITFGCPACHAGELFGTPVMGLPNRVAQANRMFDFGSDVMKVLPTTLTTWVMGGSEGDLQLLRELKDSMKYIEAKTPVALGLDTSLAQVSLSLSRRAPDPWAELEPEWATTPRPDFLRHTPADSKPAPWWTVKYKNRWLLDGSVVSGNPILTNILWNEIGRGTDLHVVDAWIQENTEIIEDLTTYVFCAQPPRYADFLPASNIDLQAAMRGQTLFVQSCTRCHGAYQKGWNAPNAEALPLEEQLRTTQVAYHAQTPVEDVGTDLSRANGMASLEQLNGLEISRRNGIVIERQRGYVPPPLEGVWARWPYFHNGSAPTLCAVLTRSEDRPKAWYVGKELNPALDFDAECNGFPALEKAPSSWRKGSHLYDTARVGAGNRGHDEGIFLFEGVELFTADQKRDLVMFLKTL